MIVAEKIVTTGEKLRRARESQYPTVTQRDVARTLEIKEERYRSYEYDRVRLPEWIAVEVSRMWGIPLPWFFDGMDSNPPKNGNKEADLGSPLFPVQGTTVEIVLASPVPGGSWIDPEDSTDFIEIPVRLYKKGRWANPVVGHSNFPYIQQGDILLWEPKPHPPVGRIILARNGDNQTTVKQLKYTESGHVLIGLNDGEEVKAPAWQAVGMLIARIRYPGPGRYSEVSNEGGLVPEELA